MNSGAKVIRTFDESEDIPIDPEFNARVCALDPLGADGACAELPEMNRAGDVPGMLDALERLAPEAGAVPDMGLAPALAAMRDLGIILGSVRRHGVEPLEARPRLAPALLTLGQRTGMVPRETILHYTIWNPTDRRQRLYTGAPEEAALLDSVRMIFPDYPTALGLSDQLLVTPVSAAEFTPLTRELSKRLQCLVDSMQYVQRNVPPAFFANDLRPYLDEITIAGTAYFGPAAAQLPLWLLDQALWGARGDDDEYPQFWTALVPYTIPRWREFHARWSTNSSISDHVIGALSAQSPPPPEVESAARELVSALRTIVTFRGRHLGIAQRAYDEQENKYTVGSGGGSIDLLRGILELTKSSSRRTRPAENVAGS